MDKSNLSYGEEYRSIYENATEGIFQSDITGRYLKVNPAMARIYGYETPQDMVDSVSNIAQQIYVNKHDRKRFLEPLKSSGYVDGFE